MVIRCKLIVALAAITHVSLHAVVSPGENIWQMVKDVGQQTDAIATLASGVGGACTNKITQADVASGVYTISQPGYYCLTENLSSASNPIISIQSSNVVLDLDQHTITGSGSNAAVQFGLANLSYIAIRNGTIKTVLYGVNQSNGGTTILYEGLKIFNASSSGIATGATIKNVRINGCSFIACVAACFLSTASVGPHNLVIENCYVNGLTTASESVIFISNFNTVYVNNCVLNTSGKVIFVASAIAYVHNIVGFNNTVFGCNSCDGIIVENCYCLEASLTRSAAYLVTGGAPTNTRCVLRHNISAGTGIRGIFIDSGSNTTTVEESVVLNAVIQGINDSATNSQFYANIAHGNGTNYIGVTTTPVVSGPTATTSYWANIS